MQTSECHGVRSKFDVDVRGMEPKRRSHHIRRASPDLRPRFLLVGQRTGLTLLLPGSLGRLIGRAAGSLEVGSCGRFSDSAATAVQLLVLECDEDRPDQNRGLSLRCAQQTERMQSLLLYRHWQRKTASSASSFRGSQCSDQTTCQPTGPLWGCSGRKKNLTASYGGRFGDDRCRTSANAEASSGW
jgi:hypothetical protein